MKKHLLQIRLGDELFQRVAARAEITGVPVASVAVMLIQQQLDQMGALTTMADMMAAYKMEESKKAPQAAQKPSQEPKAQHPEQKPAEPKKPVQHEYIDIPNTVNRPAATQETHLFD